MLRKTFSLRKILFFLFLAVVFLTTFTSAEAQSCSGAGCNGLTLGATDCATEHRFINSTPFTFNGASGDIQVMWSDTCQTAFARVSMNQQPSGINRMDLHYLRLVGTSKIYATQSRTAFTSAPYLYSFVYDQTQVATPSWTNHQDSRMFYDSRNLAWQPCVWFRKTDNTFAEFCGVPTIFNQIP